MNYGLIALLVLAVALTAYGASARKQKPQDAPFDLNEDHTPEPPTDSPSDNNNNE